MLDYLKRFLIAGIVAICVSLLFFGGKPQAEGLDGQSEHWIWPTDGTISDTYGTRLGHHKGIDIAAELNTPVYTVDDGFVSKSYYSDTYGHVIFIKHNNHLETVYAHLNKREVEEGDQVIKGDTIGRMGNTGRSYGVHLHFEVHQNEWTFEKENALNPTALLGSIEIGNVVQAIVEDNAHYVVKNIEPEGQLNGTGLETISTKHKVKMGETLWSISQKYSSSIEAIQDANSLNNTDIYESQSLVIPMSKDRTTYTVQTGDTLTAIAKKTNVTVDEIKKVNHMKADDIYPFQIISIPARE
ncbi:peptidoglycan DD-metalloendopeptidase family protein [Bacillus sp. CGMCC 1.16607]|uniref:peptidoglycan DD-metalloendopeptidase family protein n=1 Tax=Bacillus sp. CGMCC 1.16607 TaxID=3351842 RepID=UPI003634D7B9